ncbi:MAG: MFS transporter [Chloroflexi bacterium]|nr:MFS transporter [Chloroflexota bacterium]
MRIAIVSPTRLSALRPLRHRAFAGLWSAGFASNIGTWMESVSVGVLITEQTGQAAWTGLVAALASAPIAVFGPIGGTLADRLDRRRYLLVLIAAQGLLAGSLAALAATGLATPQPVAAIMLVGGILAALRMPAWQSLLPDVVPTEDLPGAMSLSSAQFNLGRVIGPAVAGVVIATGGYAWAFGANAASFGATLAATACVRLPARPGTQVPFLRHLAQGLAQASRDPGIAASVGLIAVAGLLAAPFAALAPAVAAFVFGGGSRETATLVAAQGVGAVGAAVAMTPLVERFGRGTVLLGALVLLPLGLVCYALAPTFPLAAACMVGIGGAYLGVLSGLATVVQLRAAPELRGRALSLFMVAFGTCYPAGALLQGALGDRFGLRPTIAAAARLMLAAILLLRWRRPELVKALGEC